MVQGGKGSSGNRVAMIVRPAPDYRVQLPYEILLLGRLVGRDDLRYLGSHRSQIVLGGLLQVLSLILAEVPPEEVKTISNIGDLVFFPAIT